MPRVRPVIWSNPSATTTPPPKDSSQKPSSGSSRKPGRPRTEKPPRHRRCQQEQEAREKAERKAIEAYWVSLTPEQQAELDAASTAQADPDILAMETGPLKSMGQTIRRHAYIRQLLASPEQIAAEA